MNATSTADSKHAQRVTIKVWIDFVCPYCMLGEAIIAKAAQGLDIDIEWMPFELRPYPTPTLRPEDNYLPAAWKNGVYPTAQQVGIDIRLPTVSPQPYTRKAFLGLQFAENHGKADAYVDAVLRAFFQKDLDIGETSVLKDIVLELGLPPEGLDAALSSAMFSDNHDASLRMAQAVGIRAVPSVAVGNRLFSGMPSAEVLRAAILAEAQAAGTTTA